LEFGWSKTVSEHRQVRGFKVPTRISVSG
jgi:hypothetical protein